MRRESPGAVRRFSRNCNLLPNLDAAVVYERAVLRLVVSVANSWGILCRLCARPGSYCRATRANRRDSSSCLSYVMSLGAMPARYRPADHILDSLGRTAALSPRRQPEHERPITVRRPARKRTTIEL